MYLAAPQLMEISASQIVHEQGGEIGLLLENKVPVSMKDSLYKVKIALAKMTYLLHHVNVMPVEM